MGLRAARQMLGQLGDSRIRLLLSANEAERPVSAVRYAKSPNGLSLGLRVGGLSRSAAQGISCTVVGAPLVFNIKSKCRQGLEPAGQNARRVTEINQRKFSEAENVASVTRGSSHKNCTTHCQLPLCNRLSVAEQF